MRYKLCQAVLGCHIEFKKPLRYQQIDGLLDQKRVVCFGLRLCCRAKQELLDMSQLSIKTNVEFFVCIFGANLVKAHQSDQEGFELIKRHGVVGIVFQYKVQSLGIAGLHQGGPARQLSAVFFKECIE